MDGNFKLAHVKQTNPDDDVWLAMDMAWWLRMGHINSILKMRLK